MFDFVAFGCLLLHQFKLEPFFIIMVFHLTLFIILSFLRNVTLTYQSIETSFDVQ